MYCYSQLRRLSSASREVSLYALLEVAPSASVSEIKRAFRQVWRELTLHGCCMPGHAKADCTCRKQSSIIQMSATSARTTDTSQEFW